MKLEDLGSDLFPRSVQDLATLLDGAIIGDGQVLITGLADIETASEGDIVFAENPRYLQAALRSRAAAALVAPGLAEGQTPTRSLIVVENPRHSFVLLLEALSARSPVGQGIHETAIIGEGATLGHEISIAAHVTVGAGAVIGDRVTLMSGVRVGDGCVIGDDTTLYPNVVLYAGVKIGKGCILHAGCVLGADGFGYVPVGRALRKVPHIGRVEVGDMVEIGANACIDRAKTGVTTIGAGTKIDNLVHIAHNVQIGQSCLIIAQAGIAGSVEIGHGVVLAGQAGIKDHVQIGDGARVGAQGGVIGDVAAGETVSGYPARPHRIKMRELAAVAALPELIRRVRELERRLAATPLAEEEA
jgi:UDP-3-O-[3-hydroxymyristoyl] glucosamine N-acyltransferase